MLDDARRLGLGADHEAGGVLEEQQGLAALAAQLDELRGLCGAGGIDRPVIGDDADGGDHALYLDLLRLAARLDMHRHIIGAAVKLDDLGGGHDKA